MTTTIQIMIPPYPIIMPRCNTRNSVLVSHTNNKHRFAIAATHNIMCECQLYVCLAKYNIMCECQLYVCLAKYNIMCECQLYVCLAKYNIMCECQLYVCLAKYSHMYVLPSII